MPQWLVIGISGVTCGGKTTLAFTLRDYFLNQRYIKVWSTPYVVGDVKLISQDDYFLPVNDERHKWNEQLNAINFELLTSLDMKMMMYDIKRTMQGRYNQNIDPLDNIDYMNDIAMSTGFEQYGPNVNSYQNHYVSPLQHQQQQQPIQQQQQQQQHTQNAHYTNQRHVNANTTGGCMRNNTNCTPQIREKINILIVEGFMIFNHCELQSLCNIKFHLHLPYEKCFERRRKRRYDPPDVTGYFEICVWPHYEKNFAQYRDHKDIIFLNGDMCKERIFNFALQKIMYAHERCSITYTPQQKILAVMPSCSNGNMGKVCPCPMEQQ